MTTAVSARDVQALRVSTGAGMMDCKRALVESQGDLEAAKDWLRSKGVASARGKADRETREGAVSVALAADGKAGAMVLLACETDFVARNEQFITLLEDLSQQALLSGAECFDAQSMQGVTVSERLVQSVAVLGENVRLGGVVRLEAPAEGRICSYVHTNQRIGVLVALESPPDMAAERIEEVGLDVAMHIAAIPVQAISEDQLRPEDVERERGVLETRFRESGRPEQLAEKVISGQLRKYLQEVTLLEQAFVRQPEQSVRAMLEKAACEVQGELIVRRFDKFQV